MAKQSTTADSRRPTASMRDFRYLRVSDLQRLRGLGFSPRRRVDGHFSGKHDSPQRGSAIEFADYREYTPGDPPSDIDWKVYARSDRLYVKQHEHQTNLTVQLVIDASASMAFTGVDDPTRNMSVMNQTKPSDTLRRTKLFGRKKKQQAPPAKFPDWLKAASKYDQCCLMAAAIALLVTQQQDRVGLAIARHDAPPLIPPSSAKATLGRVCTQMEQTQPFGPGQLAQTLHHLLPHTPKRALTLVFSDFLDDPEPIARELNSIAQRGGEAILFQVMHADELNLPDLPEAVMIDSETLRRVKLSPSEVRRGYQQRLRDHIDTWRRLALGLGFDHQLVSTATPYHQALRDYLNQRGGRWRR